MNSGVHWSIWLLAGVATGLLPILGERKIIGLLQTLIVVSSPVIIFTQSGTAYLPFVLFYGGLMLVSSFLFRRKNAREDLQRRESLARKKKNWGA